MSRSECVVCWRGMMRLVDPSPADPGYARCDACTGKPITIEPDGACDAEVLSQGAWRSHRCGKPAKGERELHYWAITSGGRMVRPVCGIHLRAKYTPNVHSRLGYRITAIEAIARAVKGTS